MKTLLDEKSKAEEILKTDKIYENYRKTAYLLIKYWYLTEELKHGEIVRKAGKFLEENYDDFNPTETMDEIERITRNYLKRKTPFNEVAKVKITEGELNYIRAFDDINAEKIAFVLLVRCKIERERTGKDSKWINFYEKEIYEQAKVQGTYKRRYLYTNRIEDGDIVRKSWGGDGIKIGFLDESSKVVMEIYDFREFVLEYLKWRGENIGNCEVCGVRIELVNNKKLYCKKCADNANRDKALTRYYFQKTFK